MFISGTSISLSVLIIIILTSLKEALIIGEITIYAVIILVITGIVNYLNFKDKF